MFFNLFYQIGLLQRLLFFLATKYRSFMIFLLIFFYIKTVQYLCNRYRLGKNLPNTIKCCLQRPWNLFK